jgi:hypothetical protein
LDAAICSPSSESPNDTTMTPTIIKCGCCRERYRALEPENKWGTYDNFVPWVERYLAACEEYPDT